MRSLRDLLISFAMSSGELERRQQNARVSMTLSTPAYRRLRQTHVSHAVALRVEPLGIVTVISLRGFFALISSCSALSRSKRAMREAKKSGAGVICEREGSERQWDIPLPSLFQTDSPQALSLNHPRPLLWPSSPSSPLAAAAVATCPLAPFPSWAAAAAVALPRSPQAVLLHL